VTPAFFANELATGRLVMPFDRIVEDERSYWLVYPKARSHSVKIRAFRDWLLDEVRTFRVRSLPFGQKPVKQPAMEGRLGGSELS
jgi:LysR family glycine cleavage system transcriptional activator